MFIVKLALASAVFYFALPYLGVDLTWVKALMLAIVVQTVGYVMARDTAVELTVVGAEKEMKGSD